MQKLIHETYVTSDELPHILAIYNHYKIHK